MSASTDRDVDRRLRRWRRVFVASWFLLFGPFVLAPSASYVLIAVSRPELPPPIAAPVLGLSSLACVIAGFVLIHLSLRRSMRLALERGTDSTDDASSDGGVLRGGARSEWVAASFPLAELRIDRERLTLRIFGSERFACERGELRKIAASGLLAPGLTFTTREREATFFPLDPAKLVATLRGAGYAIERG